MSESEQSHAYPPSYSDRVINAFGEAADKRLATLSVSDLEAVKMKLEHKQLTLMLELSVNDDPLESAKKRGAIAFILDFGEELMVEAMKRRVQEDVPEKEQADD